MAMYFTTDTHFGHPLVSALRGFITIPDIKAGYDRIVAEQGRDVGVRRGLLDHVLNQDGKRRLVVPLLELDDSGLVGADDGLRRQLGCDGRPRADRKRRRKQGRPGGGDSGVSHPHVRPPFQS